MTVRLRFACVARPLAASSRGLTVGLLAFTFRGAHEPANATGSPGSPAQVGTGTVPTPWPCSSRSSAAPRSPTPTASGPSPTTSPARAARATTSSSSCQRHGQGDRRPASRLANEVSHDPARPRDGHAPHRRRAQGDGAAVHGARTTSACRPSSFTGSQAGHHHRHRHGKAKILEVRADRLRDALAAGQGRRRRRLPGRVDRPRRSRTLGRGGSDTTAVALAAALGPTRARSTPTSPGVFTADPRVVPERPQAAPRLVRRDARDGGHRRPEVLALRSVEFARNHGVPLHVRSSFTWEPGTWVDRGGPRHGAGRSSPASRTTRPRPRSRSPACPTGPASRRRCSARSPTRDVNVDMIVQNVSTDGTTDISFTVPKADLDARREVAGDARRRDRRRRRDRPTPTSPRCRSSAPGMKTQPRRRRHDVRDRWPTTASTSR